MIFKNSFSFLGQVFKIPENSEIQKTCPKFQKLFLKFKIGKIYNKGLINNKNYVKPLESTSYGKNIYWVYGVLIAKPKLSVKKIVKKLKKVGIETRPFFWPLHQQPILKKLGLFKNIKLPVSEYLSKNGFYLPSGLSLNKKQQAYVIKNFNKIIS